MDSEVAAMPIGRFWLVNVVGDDAVGLLGVPAAKRFGAERIIAMGPKAT